jgi:hypothetical protein
MLDMDIPAVRAEVEAAFARYEAALQANDVGTLNALFHDGAETIRYGVAENLYGHDEIAAFRGARSQAGLVRSLARTVITTYGRDAAVASTLFRRSTMPGKLGRQMQTWIRFPEGWQIVAAHVSLIDEGA